MTGGSVRTELNNNMQYASYVNDGHRVDKHFVPGLIINGNLLERSPDGSGGIMVGTKTSYVQGKYMKEAGIGRYLTSCDRQPGRYAYRSISGLSGI